MTMGAPQEHKGGGGFAAAPLVLLYDPLCHQKVSQKLFQRCRRAPATSWRHLFDIFLETVALRKKSDPGGLPEDFEFILEILPVEDVKDSMLGLSRGRSL